MKPVSEEKSVSTASLFQMLIARSVKNEELQTFITYRQQLLKIFQQKSCFRCIRDAILHSKGVAALPCKLVRKTITPMKSQTDNSNFTNFEKITFTNFNEF